MTPGRDRGRVTLRNASHPRGVQVAGGVHQRPVEPLDRGVQRQHHEGQVAVEQPDEHRGLGEQHLAPQPGGLADPGHRPVGVEQDPPGVGAHQEVRPERDQHQHQQQVPGRGLGPGGDPVGERVADQQADHRVEDRQPQAAGDDGAHHRLGQPGVRVEVPALPAPAGRCSTGWRTRRRRRSAAAGRRRRSGRRTRGGRGATRAAPPPCSASASSSGLTASTSGGSSSMVMRSPHSDRASAAWAWKLSTGSSPTSHTLSRGMFSTRQSTMHPTPPSSS